MANPEHLKIFKQGVDAWNKWRRENPGIRPSLCRTSLVGADLTKANLIETDLSETNLHGAKFAGANLSVANLSGANLHAAILNGARLVGAFFKRTNLSGADLSLAELAQANFEGADLRDADLSGAVIVGARLIKADLSGANLENSNFAHAEVYETVFGNNDLRGVNGLQMVNHRGASIIGIDTIYRSKGEIPEVFLRGAGVPEDFIIYMRSLVGKAIDFYSCFISYSSKDDGFAQRLHADLQQKGVRCWFAPEDLKIGDKFRTRIDESIRTYDKLMVILSENSIRSPWVEEEVEGAFEKEHKQNKLVLFPIRLDVAIMETDQA